MSSVISQETEPHLVITTPHGLNTFVYLFDDRRVVTGGSDGTLRMWILENGQQEGESIHHGHSVHHLSAIGDGKLMIGCDDRGRVQVWDVASQQPVKEWTHPEPFPTMAVSPNDLLVAVGQKRVRIHAVQERWQVKKSIDVCGQVSCMAFSPDGDRLACGVDADVRVYDIVTGACLLGPLTGHERRCRSVLWSGNRLISGSYDKTIRCWHSETGAKIGRPWTGHTKQINSLSLSPDGSVLASASLDQTVRFWDVATGENVGRPTRHDESVGTVCFSPLGRFVASATFSGKIYVWRIEVNASQVSTFLLVNVNNTNPTWNSSAQPALPHAFVSTKSHSATRSLVPTEPSSAYDAVGELSAAFNLMVNISPPSDLTSYLIRRDDHYIAGGGFGDVYRCWYQADGLRKQVAVKALRFKFERDEDALDGSAKMLRREIGIWRRLEHKNIVPFLGIAYGFGMRGAMSLVSLWMPNESLYDFLDKYNGRLEMRHRLQFLLDIADGLHYLHSFPITHGDLNCNNVLLDGEYTARLTDFGLASSVGNIPEALTYLQRSTSRPGALRWMAPEQLESEDMFTRTTKSDIYSFGCIMLQVLSGRQPWSEVQSDIAVISHLARGHKPARPGCETLLDPHWRFINACWSRLEDRPGVGAVVLAVRRFLDGTPSSQPLGDLVLSWMSQNLSLADVVSSL